MLTRRSLIQGVLSLAALGPLGRVAVGRGDPLLWTPNPGVALLTGYRAGPTVLRARLLFGTWADAPAEPPTTPRPL